MVAKVHAATAWAAACVAKNTRDDPDRGPIVPAPTPPPDRPGKDAEPASRPPPPHTNSDKPLQVLVWHYKGVPADWRLYLDGKPVAGKAESFDFRQVWPAGGDSFEVFYGSACVFRRNALQIYETTEDRFEFAVGSGKHRVELMSRQLVLSNMGRPCPTFPYNYQFADWVLGSDSDPSNQVLRLQSVPPVAPGGEPDGYCYTLDSDIASKDFEDRIGTSVTATEGDPIIRSLLAAEQLFQSGSRPTRRTLLLELPREDGGPRECDGGQVRVLVDWLAEKHFGWTPPKGFRPQIVIPNAFADPNPAATERQQRDYQEQADRLNQKVAAARADIRRLAVVADYLDKAPAATQAP